MMSMKAAIIAAATNGTSFSRMRDRRIFASGSTWKVLPGSVARSRVMSASSKAAGVPRRTRTTRL
jgi:hypothetical protein